MRELQPDGVYADVVQAPSPLTPKIPIRLGVEHHTFEQYRERGLFAPIAHYYGIVQCGVRQARHVFRGLKRPMAVADDMQADQNIFVYSWRPRIDYEWAGTTFNGKPVRHTPKARTVFVVLIRLQAVRPEIWGVIEKWNWVREDPDLAEAPVNWEQRYEQKMWSRG